MKYNELVLKRQDKPKRAGRGISAGRGMTAGRGTKGQGARARTSIRPGFEGGQTPLHMRLPKLRGFKSHQQAVENVFTAQLNDIKKASVDTTVLFEAGLISSPHVYVKLLLRGEITAKKDVKLPSASKSAIAAIEKAGGTFIKVDRLPRAKQKSSDSASN